MVFIPIIPGIIDNSMATPGHSLPSLSLTRKCQTLITIGKMEILSYGTIFLVHFLSSHTLPSLLPFLCVFYLQYCDLHYLTAI